MNDGYEHPKYAFNNIDYRAPWDGESVVFTVENTLPEYLQYVPFGTEITIKQLPITIQGSASHTVTIIWDDIKPDGMTRQLMYNSKIQQLG